MRVTLVKGEITTSSSFSLCSDGCECLVSVITYMEAQFIARSLFHFSIGEEEAGRESICEQFSGVALMDLCGQLNLLFITGKIGP